MNEVISKLKKVIYHIEDTRSGFVVSTFLSNSEAEAERTFKAEVDDEKSLLHKYPNDFILVKDGEIIHTTYIEDMAVKTKTEVLGQADIIKAQKAISEPELF